MMDSGRRSSLGILALSLLAAAFSTAEVEAQETMLGKRFAGSYVSFTHNKALGPAWQRAETVQVDASGRLIVGGWAIRGAEVSGATVSWTIKAGNRFAGQVTFKAKDSSPFFWGEGESVGVCFTGWRQRAGRRDDFCGLKLAGRRGVVVAKVGKRPKKPVFTPKLPVIKPKPPVVKVTPPKIRVRPKGLSQEQRAVYDSLDWLARHQSPDGRWDSDGWKRCCSKKGRCMGRGQDSGDARYDVGVTSLALMAFLGDGHSHKAGFYKATVNRGVRWLVTMQRRNGAIGFDDGEAIYNHALATVALCEVLALTKDETLKKPCKAAVSFCLKAQNPGMGWKYGLRPGNNDTSVTGLMVVALRSARLAGLKVPDEAFKGAQNWLKRATALNGAVGYQRAGGGSSYIPRQKGKFDEVPCMTAVALVARVYSGSRVKDEDDLKKGAKLLGRSLPVWPGPADTRRVNFYYWYYGTYAMSKVGGKAWARWSEKLRAALLPRQRGDGCDKGSWEGVGEWCIAGGRVYATAINSISLEVFIRHRKRFK